MTPSKELLTAQASFLDYPPGVFYMASAKEREAAKALFVRKLKRQAAKLNTSPDVYVAAHMQNYPETQADLDRINKRTMLPTPSKQQVEEKRRTGRPKGSKNKPKVEVIGDTEPAPPSIEEEDVDELPESGFVFGDDDEPPYEDQEGLRVYHEAGTYPPDGAAKDRDGPTVGVIRERVKPPLEDLVGDRPPRTLTDLYARWPIAQDSQFFLRIERIKPKRYYGVDCAGFIGEVRGRPCNEADISRTYGGGEYRITLYGPDPRGTNDEDGNIKVKALTDGISLTVPVIPPVLVPIQSEGPPSMNPFGPTVAQQPPTTAGDASIHKANTNFLADVLKLTKAEEKESQREQAKITSSMIGFVTQSQQSQIASMQEDSKRREDLLKEQINELKKAVDRARSDRSDVASEVARSKDESTRAMLQLIEKMGPDKEAEVRRLAEYYTAQAETARKAHAEQLEILRKSHTDQLQGLRDRHDADLRRADERVSDLERSYRQMLEQERGQARQMLDTERSQWRDREKDLRDQMKEQGENERKMAEARLADMKERHEAEIKNLERGHERELRSMRESSDVKLNVSEQTNKMALQSAAERLEDAREEAERAREEAEKAKDLTAVLEGAEKQARLLGFEKADDNAPKGALERFAATAGAGLAQALSTAQEWVPQVLAQRQQQQAVRAQLPPQQRPPQQAGRPLQQNPQQQRPQGGPPQPQQSQGPQGQPQQGPVRRSNSAQWAAEGVRVAPPAQTTKLEPLGFQQVPEETKPVEQPVHTPEPTNGNGASNALADIQLPENVMRLFPSKEAFFALLGQAENAVNLQMEPSIFAEQLVAFAAEDARRLIGHLKAEDILDAVAGIPGAENSPLLRREGRNWLDRLWKAVRKELAKTEAQAESTT